MQIHPLGHTPPPSFPPFKRESSLAPAVIPAVFKRESSLAPAVIPTL